VAPIDTQATASESPEFPTILGLVFDFLADRGVRDNRYAMQVASAYFRSLNEGQSRRLRLRAIRQVPSYSLFGAGTPGKSRVTEALVEYLDTVPSSADTVVSSPLALSPSEVPRMRSDSELHGLVVDVLFQLKSDIEAMCLWQPFWDEHHSLGSESSDVTCPVPKREPSVQPTLLQLLRDSFRHLGVEILREPNEGVGLLDFRCVSTSSGAVHNTCIESKLAHHEHIRAGVSGQLPAYMDSVGTSFGVYLVLWFKDGNYWHKPTKYQTPEDLRADVQAVAHEVPSKTIQVIVLDVTRKTSASRRR